MKFNVLVCHMKLWGRKRSIPCFLKTDQEGNHRRGSYSKVCISGKFSPIPVWNATLLKFPEIQEREVKHPVKTSSETAMQSYRVLSPSSGSQDLLRGSAGWERRLGATTLESGKLEKEVVTQAWIKENQETEEKQALPHSCSTPAQDTEETSSSKLLESKLPPFYSHPGVISLGLEANFCSWKHSHWKLLPCF